MQEAHLSAHCSLASCSCVDKTRGLPGLVSQKVTCSRCLSTSQGILTTVPNTVPNPLASACICTHHSHQLSTWTR